jgi:hypothetical protein
VTGQLNPVEFWDVQPEETSPEAEKFALYNLRMPVAVAGNHQHVEQARVGTRWLSQPTLPSSLAVGWRVA